MSTEPSGASKKSHLSLDVLAVIAALLLMIAVRLDLVKKVPW